MMAMVKSLSEDDIYRASSQYRLWSYTAASLAASREATNTSAIDAIIASEAQDGDETTNTIKVDCLTVQEELALVNFYCIKAMQLADFCEFPTNVKATAIQYLKRFYLTNSPMTYHPKEIMPSAVFLSTKTENHYTPLRTFVSKIPKATTEAILAPEFLLSQSLRFTFDVRHPQRGLEGGFMELMLLARGKMGASIQQEMIGLELPKESSKESSKELPDHKSKSMTVRSQAELINRIQSAHGRAKNILKTAALLSDVYFHHTPAQIWMAAMLIADRPLISFYLKNKFSSILSTFDNASGDPEQVRTRIMENLEQCVTMLDKAPDASPNEENMQELMRIDKKLYRCRNRHKTDLIEMHRAQKRNGDASKHENGADLNINGIDESAVKKRKLERQKSQLEADNVFGPSLGSAPT